MIKAIIFDIGGVILEMDRLALPVVEVFKPKDANKFWQDLNEKFSPLCGGEGTLIDFWRDIAKANGKTIPDDVLNKLWNEDFENNLYINNQTKDLIVKLKKNYKLAIISNTIAEHANKLRQNTSFKEIFKLFDVVILSNEVKMAKDNQKIFLHTLKLLNLKPEECVFTDDTKKFVGVAKSLGINAIQFKNAEQFKKDLKKLGVMV